MLNKVSQRIMERVLELSQNNLDENKVPIAAVIFDPQAKKIISEAKNTDDPLGHAEMLAIRKATKKLKQDRLNGLDIYVTIEPCPMCAYAISKVNLTKVYFGCEDQKGGGIFNGVKIYTNSNIWKPEVISHVYENESRNLIQQFFKNKRKNKAL